MHEVSRTDYTGDCSIHKALLPKARKNQNKINSDRYSCDKPRMLLELTFIGPR